MQEVDDCISKKCYNNTLWDLDQTRTLNKGELEVSIGGLIRGVTKVKIRDVGKPDHLEFLREDTHSKARPWCKLRHPQQNKSPQHSNKSQHVNPTRSQWEP